MKKLFLFIFAFLLISTNSYCQERYKKIKGNVKSITRSIYSVSEKFGEIQKNDLQGSYIQMYNKKGNIECFGCGKNTEIKYYYDSKNELIKEQELNRNSVLKIKTYLNDERGNNIEKTLFENGEIVYKNKMKHNQNNLLTEMNVYNSNGDLGGKSIYKYDSKGNNTLINEYSSNGNLKWKVNKKYDERGNCIKLEEWSETSLNKEIVSVYDKTNNLISYKITFADDYMKKYNSYSTYVNKYDSKGNKISELSFENGKADYLSIDEIEYYPTIIHK
jgi:hypothetical protein